MEFRAHSLARPMNMMPIPVAPPVATTIAVLFFMAWPFLAAMLLRSRRRSSAPLLAMLVPIAVGTACAYAILLLTLQHLAITGAKPIVEAALVRHSGNLIRLGVLDAVVVAIAMMMRHHAPAIDRVLVLLASMVVVEIAGARGIAAMIASGQWQFPACYAGIAISSLTAAAAMLRIILLRGPSVPSPAAASR
jgi:hypothetical protein